MIVVDTNVLINFLMSGPHTIDCEKVYQKDNEWIAPYLWRSEFRNVLKKQMQNSNITLTNALEVMQDAMKIMSDNEYEVRSFRVLSLAKESGCSAYDCEYVSLASDLNVKLITNDKEVLKKFTDISISPKEFIQQ